MRSNHHFELLNLAALTVVLCLGAIPIQAEEPQDRSGNISAAACEALETTDFSTIQDAPTQIMETHVLDAAGEVPATCQVHGYIAPQVGFTLRLPISAWNRKFIQIGCGGSCGSTSLMSEWCDDALRRGYVCILSDQGHTSTKAASGKNVALDGLWAYNNLQAEIDIGFRAVHVAALAGKVITEHYYGAEPKASYFLGCSSGGRRALISAQRFPWDYDGIIAMDPSNLMPANVTLLWNDLVTRDKNDKPLFTPADIDVLHNAVLVKCDLDDGVKDGVIGYPPACKFDPAELTCEAGQARGCLSPIQVEAAKKVYSGPMTSKGEKLFLHYGAMPGSEKGSLFSANDGLRRSNLNLFRYQFFVPAAGSEWKSADFDFDTDYKRLGMKEMLVASDNPDLRKFEARGGKLIIAQGWDDSGSPFPLNSIDYYEMVEKAMGGRASTEKFARLFMIPGRAHCGGGPGANAIDFLGYLEGWVERGRAPDMMIGAHVESGNYADFLRLPKDPGMAKFTRPIYPYPLQAKYKGVGDPGDYRNFAPFKPATQ